MYDSDPLAFTGTGIVVGGAVFELYWLSAVAAGLIIAGVLLMRATRRVHQ